MAGLDDDMLDELLYLARANEGAELEALLAQLCAQTSRSRPALVGAAVDPHSNNSALHYAAANGHNEIIRLLCAPDSGLPAPEIVNAANSAGNTPLHWAALNGHLDSVKLLVQFGADVTVINAAGHDAVFEAEINDKRDVVEWLLATAEELEAGIGGAGETRGDASESQHDTQPADSASTVEDVRKQMEDLKTRGGVSQDG